MKIALMVLGGLALLGVAAMAVFVFYVQNVETPAYQVVTQAGDLEVRDYPRLVVAEVRRQGPRQEALRAGFGPLARYIFAEERAGERIGMTAPVTQQRPERISMTAPVTAQVVTPAATAPPATFGAASAAPPQAGGPTLPAKATPPATTQAETGAASTQPATTQAETGAAPTQPATTQAETGAASTPATPSAPVPLATAAATQARDGGEDWAVRFIMPARYGLEQLPAPAGSEVRLSEVPPRRVAAIRFSGRASDELIASKEAELRAWLEDRGLKAAAPAIYAFYNDPFTPGFLRRNEVLIDLAEAPAGADPSAPGAGAKP